jgi:MscS family membrane protein
MWDFLDYTFLNNSVRIYLIEIGTIILAILLKRFLSKYIARLICKALDRAGKKIDKNVFINLVIAPLEWFLLILVIIIALDKLTYPDVLKFELYHIPSIQIAESISISILIVVFFWLLLRLIDFIAYILEQKANLTEDQSDNQLIVFFKDFFKIILILIGFLMVLKFAFKYNIGTLLTGLSLVGAAIALATRESLENLIASFIIFFDKPFTTGDFVKVLNVTGTVERIGLRSTRIRTTQKTYITVPNKQMVDSVLDNQTLRTQLYGTFVLDFDSNNSHEQITGLLEGIREILKAEAIVENFNVTLPEINHTIYLVQAEYFVTPVETTLFLELKERINLAVIKLLEDKQILLSSGATVQPIRNR